MCVDLSNYRRYLNQILYRAQAPHYYHDGMFQMYTTWKSNMVAVAVLDFAICAKFGGQTHHGHADITHDQNLKPELCLRDVIVVMNKDVYITWMSGT